MNSLKKNHGVYLLMVNFQNFKGHSNWWYMTFINDKLGKRWLEHIYSYIILTICSMHLLRWLFMIDGNHIFQTFQCLNVDTLLLEELCKILWINYLKIFLFLFLFENILFTKAENSSLLFPHAEYISLVSLSWAVHIYSWIFVSCICGHSLDFVENQHCETTLITVKSKGKWFKVWLTLPRFKLCWMNGWMNVLNYEFYWVYMQLSQVIDYNLMEIWTCT